MTLRDAEPLCSALLTQAGFQHAFFTRRGGVSRGAYESLNFSASVGDEPENVALNLARAAEVLHVKPDRIFFLSQVHGNDVKWITEMDSREIVADEQGDAVLSTATDVACAVRTADCVPILVGDRRSGAAAAIHAGWRGAVRGVIGSALSALRSRVVADGDLVVAIGPHISVAAFEVSDDVARELEQSCSDREVVARTPGKKPHVDLRRLVRAQLRSFGVANECIDDVGGCTLSEPELYFSFRRDGPKSGRHLSAIMPRKDT
jgi:hypothetical protein